MELKKSHKQKLLELTIANKDYAGEPLYACIDVLNNPNLYDDDFYAFCADYALDILDRNKRGKK